MSISSPTDETSDAKNPSFLISPEELKQLLQSNDVRLFDVRESTELDTEGRIEQSVNIPVKEIETAFRMKDANFKSKYGVDKPCLNDCNLVFHCRSGKRSYDAVMIAHNLGYTCPKSLEGGIIAWKRIFN